MAAPSKLGIIEFFRRRRGPRRCLGGRGGSHPRLLVGPRQGAVPGPLVAPQVALRRGGVFLHIKIPRKFSSNSENISISDFLKYKNSKNREVALGILSIG